MTIIIIRRPNRILENYFEDKMLEEKRQELINSIHSIEHPEIASTLNELGMIGNIEFDNEENSISVILNLPMMTIPIQIRDMLINSIVEALKQKASGTKLKISLAQMTDEQRRNFFFLSKQNWKA